MGKVLMALFVAGLLSGCQPQPQPVDMSLLTHDPCAPPCWEHIIPGVSDADDVRTRLEESPFVRKDTIRWWTFAWREGKMFTKFTWKSTAGSWDRRFEGGNEIGLYYKGPVLWITLGLEYPLTLGQVVEKYGPPEGLFLSLGPYGEKDVSLCYLRRGMWFKALGPRISDQEMERRVMIIPEDLEVGQVTYFSTEGERYTIGIQTMPFVEWHGFGEYGPEP